MYEHHPSRRFPSGVVYELPKKRIAPSDDPLLDVFEESIPRSAPSASSKKYPYHCDRQSKSFRCSGFLCQVVGAVQA